MDRIVRAIDAVSTAAGWLVGWFIVPITAAVSYEVVARYAFDAPTKWSYEVGWMRYGAQFMLAAAYMLLKGGHIRTDVLYERWLARTRATVDAVCYVLFFFPGMLCILYAGAVEARHTWAIGERTGLRIVSVATPGGRRVRPLSRARPRGVATRGAAARCGGIGVGGAGAPRPAARRTRTSRR